MATEVDVVAQKGIIISLQPYPMYHSSKRSRFLDQNVTVAIIVNSQFQIKINQLSVRFKEGEGMDHGYQDRFVVNNSLSTHIYTQCILKIDEDPEAKSKLASSIKDKEISLIYFCTY